MGRSTTLPRRPGRVSPATTWRSATTRSTASRRSGAPRTASGAYPGSDAGRGSNDGVDPLLNPPRAREAEMDPFTGAALIFIFGLAALFSGVIALGSLIWERRLAPVPAV